MMGDMIKWRMLAWLEDRFIQVLFDRYPEWEWTPRIVRVGARVEGWIRGFSLDPRLLKVQRPTVRDRVRAVYAYYRDDTLFRLECEANSMAERLFVDCYFLRLADARRYFLAVFFPRYFAILARKTFTQGLKLLAARDKGAVSGYDVYALCLAACYPDGVSMRIAK